MRRCADAPKCAFYAGPLDWIIGGRVVIFFDLQSHLLAVQGTIYDSFTNQGLG